MSVAPRRGRASRSQTAAQARYDAGGMSRRVAKWTPPTAGPNRAIEGLQRIRDRARDVRRNDWAGSSSNQKWSTALVGVGITPRWTNEAFNTLWAEFGPMADADGVLDVYGMQTLGVETWLDAGEVFLRRRPRPLVTKFPAPVQFQLIEAEYCPLFDADTWQGMPQGNTIRQGIERNAYGERTAYWMYREHPSDGAFGATIDRTKLIRIPASEIQHVFKPDRPGQLRGVSHLAPVLVKLRDVMDYENVVLDRQKLANLFTLFITRAMPPDWADLELDDVTGFPKVWFEKGQPGAQLGSGLAQELNPGEDVKFANPPEAGTTYSEYLRTNGLGVAAGNGLPYEFLTGDLKDISDRTLRILVNEFRRLCEQRQWQIVIPMLCQRMVVWWADSLVLAGKITQAQLAEVRRPEWTPHGWPDIHPTQDIEGRKLEVEMGVRSTSEIIRKRGDDPKKVREERKKDAQEDRAAGLTSALVPPAPAPAAGNPSPAKGKPAPDPNAQLVEVAQALLAIASKLQPPEIHVAPAAPAAAAPVRPTQYEERVEYDALGRIARVIRADKVFDVVRNDDQGRASEVQHAQTSN